MAAKIARLRTKADRLRSDTAAQLRQLVLEYPGLPERARGEIIGTIDRQTASEAGWRHRQVGARWVARGRGAGYRPGMTPPITPSYAGHRFPPEVISHAVWLYFRFPLGLRMVEELLAARGITVSHETVRQWALKFGQAFANEIRRRLPRPGDKWHLDEVEIKIAGRKHWLWRAVDRDGTVLDVLVQSRRDKRAAKRLL